MSGNCFEVLVSKAAFKDLQVISDFYLLTATDLVAEKLITRIENGFETLNQFPERGNPVYELVTIGVMQYKQLLVKPFRLIYSINNQQVRVHMVLHQKQSIQKALVQRNLH